MGLVVSLQIDGTAGLVAQPGALVRIAFAILLHVLEGPFHDDGEFVDEGRFEGCMPSCDMPISGEPMD